MLARQPVLLSASRTAKCSSPYLSALAMEPLERLNCLLQLY
jgi:hypothetical protein